jgi:ATP-binding cassette, subfamily G (WHITE), member 2
VWVDEKESFNCALDECVFQLDSTHDANRTTYTCQKVRCECIPDRLLCGADGSIGSPYRGLLSVDISDFLREEIKGPATFSCSGEKNGCKFEEPAMNELIGNVFGDRSIFLNCEASECLHYSEVPGYQVSQTSPLANSSVQRNPITPY